MTWLPKKFITISIDLELAYRDFSFVWEVPFNCILNTRDSNFVDLTFHELEYHICVVLVRFLSHDKTFGHSKNSSFGDKRYVRYGRIP